MSFYRAFKIKNKTVKISLFMFLFHHFLALVSLTAVGALVTSSGFSAASFSLLARIPTSLAIERAC